MTPSRATKKLTIVIPALNEQDKIADTIDGVLPLARELLDDFEIFLIDDGSTDATGAIMDEFAAGEPRIIVHHNAERRGVGAGFEFALSRAKFDAITLIPGDHAFHNEGIARMFKAAGAADIVITYRDNQSDRSINRSLQSHSLRFILNCALRLRTYFELGGTIVSLLRRVPIRNVDFSQIPLDAERTAVR
ncbi:glycosyltransferase family 2 protein [Bradyrhizobium liaoningense]